jgi:putative membrane protein
MGWSGTGAPPVRRLARWGLTLGVALCVALVVRQGVGSVAAAIASVGSGILAILLLHLAQVTADGMGWRALLAGEPRPPAGLFVWGRWIAESVNDLLPVMGVGGNVVRARALAGAGVPGPTAGASVLVDITVIMMTQLPVTLLGLGLLVVYFDAGALVGRVLLGVLVPASMLAGFVLAQRRGLFGAGARLVERFVQSPTQFAISGSAAAIDREVHRLYRNRAALLAAAGWHGLGWLIGTTEVWLTLHYLGHTVSFASAVMWQTLAEVVRTAAFFVPGALGVQEASYLVLGRLLGVSPAAALALSLIGRARDLIFGVPGLLAWRAWAAAAPRSRRATRIATEVE